MANHQLSRELEVAASLARRAGEITLGYWRTGLEAETKDDLSPVTRADKESERLIVEGLTAAFPDDGLLGEEGARRPAASGRRWIIDPIDGTRDFVRGNTAWAILIALEDDGEVVLGVAYLPAMGDLFHAVRGGGAFCNGSPIRASGIDRVSQAVLCLNGFNSLDRFPFPELVGWLSGFWAVRSMGGCLDAMLVARGQAEIWLDSNGKAWDYAPLKIIAEEAGAHFLNFDGGRSPHGGSCILCAPGLEAEVRRMAGL
jgi:histidinol phosphatase-like enzyme (inositol monophosphatase family)